MWHVLAANDSVVLFDCQVREFLVRCSSWRLPRVLHFVAAERVLSLLPL
jgi:hypothetical protein